jgi:hypothetical protein
VTDDPFCELRIYRVAAGRSLDMEARVQRDLRTLFPRHGIRPLACWSTMASPVAPAFVYVTPWANTNQRSASWAGFYADPDWAEVRARTNGSSELVESYEILFVRAILPWAGQAETCAFAELVIQDCAVGKAASVAAELKEYTVPLLTREGASVHGVFEIMSGRPLPALVLFLGWDNLQQRSNALGRLDERSQHDRANGHLVLLGRAEQHLMRHVRVDWS